MIFLSVKGKKVCLTEHLVAMWCYTHRSMLLMIHEELIPLVVEDASLKNRGAH